MDDNRVYLDEKLNIICDGTDINPLDYTVISVTEYQKLCEAYDKLEALECYGVDNWEGYGDAMQSLYNDEEDY